MKITVFNGSHKGERGNTNVMVQEFLAGAEEAQAEVENVFLVQKEIKYCRGCYVCWIKTPGKCVLKDDMADLLEKLVHSDIVVFASPLYVDNVSGVMKMFMDRILPLMDPYFVKDKNGEYGHAARYDKRPKLVAMANSGFPEQSHFQVLSLLYKRIARNMQTELIAEIYRGGGAVLNLHSAEFQPFINDYKSLLRQAGKEIVQNYKISAATAEKLAKPLMPVDQYIDGSNNTWQKLLARIEG